MPIKTTQKPEVAPYQLLTTNDGTANGDLTEIRCINVQNGVVIQNSNAGIDGIPAVNPISDSFCPAQKTVLGDTNSFADKSGLKAMGDALAQGMVLIMSIWDDHAAEMLWLDSGYPTDADPSNPGVSRGPCATTSGVPTDVESSVPNSTVVFSNIKWGDLGSTFPSGPSSSVHPTFTSSRCT
ncbi:Exoglucanase 1 [Tulasnella sp. 403]|nr:Exoglucanase 1 [Tulasnella sp. 403]